MIFSFNISSAQWQTNGIPVCDTSANTGIYMLPKICSDDLGGAIVCWRDVRDNNYDVYAQHIANDGKMLWQKNGIPIVVAPYDQDYPRIISDGRNGAFIAWEDARTAVNNYIYVQRINYEGQALWQNQGVKVAETEGFFISLALDKNNGLLIAWNGPGIGGVTAQRMDSAGNRLWGDSGVCVSNRPTNVASNDVAIISDNTGGAIVAWSQGDYLKEQVFVQRIDSTGKPLWATNGIPVSDTCDNICVTLSSDRQGGGLISWARFANGPVENSAVIVQRVTNTGIFLWGQTGISLNATVGGGARRHTDDGHGGAFIGHGKYIQHIDSAGNKLLAGEGVQYTIAPTLYYNSAQALNGDQGIWNFWTYHTPDTTNMLANDIYGQYIDIMGNIHWGNFGLPICSLPGIQDRAQAIDNSDGTAIVVWHDTRNGSYTSVYAVKVDTGKIITDVKNFRNNLLPRQTKLEQNYPNPFNPETTISFTLPKRCHVKLIVYDILGKEIKTLLNEERSAGSYSINFDSARLSSGTYFYCLLADDNLLTKKMIVIK